ncbi:MAG: cytochrome P450 [Ardenticatenia bacterium]|nr:cytochrome P450 [Ardenticatenia bacterium]
MVAHFLPELFADPFTYDPLRFAPGREEDKADRFALIGFGGGIHKCAGMNFANQEMFVITALLFQQFDVELLTPSPSVERGLGASRPTPTWIRLKRKAHFTRPNTFLSSAAGGSWLKTPT